MRNVMVNKREGMTFGRRTVKGVSQVFVLFNGEGIVTDTPEGVGVWVVDSPSLYV